ncbi:phosphopantothenate--cysteine ligase [Enterococcus dispar]|uniref:phosphopantothenate--cysteine ligase n=1 Tax=Enterococcus dispar TaxID=44009 RepID=UPI0018A088E9|nr:phosphopantothenate--cysteine ligase [Enterococcus dispar]MCU7358019.1 phosphopantothenate--cysteine ligase [Enterococcus dispar]MDT2705522.1 phosphopantothenate--cysteine ligase [Enterococcus dispar]
MRILITAGGTAEKIDDVRSITNHSSGRLGVTIANTFAASTTTIDYVTTANALKPRGDNIRLHLISDTQNLSTTLHSLLIQNHYDAVIHSMAVSDFTPATSLSEEQLLTVFNQLITKHHGNSLSMADLKNSMSELEQLPILAKKISSDTDHLFLILKKNPKIIQLIKQLQPDTILVGFKLLVDVNFKKLHEAATNSIKKNDADFILANDLTEVSTDKHHGYLIAKDGSYGEASTKKEIAELIKAAITTTLKK